MNLETYPLLEDSIKSPKVNALLRQLDKPLITGVALSEPKIRSIYYGTEEMVGIKQLLKDGFNLNGGHLNGEFEEAYMVAMVLDKDDNTPYYIKKEIEKVQEMVTK